MKYAFFLDIDGTLTWGSHIPEQNIAAIKKARAEGHLFFINTGRSLAFIPRFVLESIEFDGIVAGSGSYCSYNDRVISAYVIPKEDLKKTMEYFAPIGRAIIFEGENEVLVYRHRSKEHPAISAPDEFDGIYSWVKIEKIHIPGILTPDELEFMSSLFYTVQQDNYAESAVKGRDKAVGMNEIMRELSSDYKSVAVGDSFNDIEMMQSADISVAMGNSPESVKALCDIVTCGSNEGGVAMAIEQITDPDRRSI